MGCYTLSLRGGLQRPAPMDQSNPAFSVQQKSLAHEHLKASQKHPKIIEV